MDYALIQTSEELEALARTLRGERVIAVDTEADSFFHYFEKLCLLQFGTRDRVFLVDPLALATEATLKPIAQILADPRIRKVFHAAEYDLYVLQRSGGLKVRSLFDTMVCAQLLGYPAVGLAALVERHFKVGLSKDQQRTDWSRRPLRSAQLAYAAADVRYLLDLSERLEEELRAKGRLAWAKEEFRALESRVWPEREFDPEGYLKIKGARGLDPEKLAVLRELYLMRDARAREQDRPPFKVLGNGTLLDLAQRPCKSRRALSERRGITELVIKRLGAEILEATRRGLEGREHPPLEPKAVGPGRRRLDRRGEAQLERLRAWRARRAASLEMDPGVFCPNATLEEIAAAGPESLESMRVIPLVKGWWVDSFGREVLECLAGTPDASSPDAARERARRERIQPGQPGRSRRRRSRRRRRPRAIAPQPS
jgi:ribonuclease D